LKHCDSFGGLAGRVAAAAPGRAVRVLALLGAVLLAACAADRPDPTPLEAYEPRIAGRQVWQLQLSGFNFPMVPSVRDGVVFVADNRGAVLALQAEDGAPLWRADLGEPLSAGVGSDGRYASVVTRGNEVVVLDKGRELWRKRVASTVVTPPLVAGERVFVMGVDRAVHAFDVLDGRRLWSLQRPGDALTLAQASVVAPFGNSLLVAQGSRLAAVDPLLGQLQWETPLATPRGTNEVERLADLVGPMVRVGDRVCARAFQSAVACADARRGALLWSRNVGGGNAVASDDQQVYGADASDRITAWRASNGDVAWTSERMLYRGLSGAVAAGPVVVFGDSEGWVHFLATADGTPQLRLPTDSSGVVGTPALSGSTMLVATRKGGLYAFRPQ
jgi:outer membrane assembly lipoprotein YfgL